MDPERVEPGAGQESVWDYPRPPALRPTSAHLRVELDGTVVAETSRAHRICETSQPPAYYFPPDDVESDVLRPVSHRTFCEWKGTAEYFDVVAGPAVARRAAWVYRDPVPRFAPVAGHPAFHAQLLDCFVEGERVVANEGAFYGGWITSGVVGPFKGAAGTAHW